MFKNESPHHEDEDEDKDKVPQSPDTATEAGEQRKAMEDFLFQLKGLTTKLQVEAAAERPRSPRDGEHFEGIPAEKIEEQARERKERKVESIWVAIMEEGVNKRNLTELLRNIGAFSQPELQTMLATIDDLIRELDPTMQLFLQNIKRELQAMTRLSQNTMNQASDQVGPELLKDQERTVSKGEEMGVLIAEYESRGWKVETRDGNHAKLVKSINTVMPSTSRMRGMVKILEVNITVAKQ